MIEHELLFLGLLKDGPKHGYEIKRVIEDVLLPLVGLKVKSIYYPLNKMEKLGLIKKETGREGNFPEKYIYALTSKGEKAFDRLIAESFLSIERPYFNIDLSLYFLPYVDKKIAYRRLRARVMFLKRIRKNLENLQQRKNFSSEYFNIILEHDLDLVDAEIKSVSRLMEAL